MPFESIAADHFFAEEFALPFTLVPRQPTEEANVNSNSSSPLVSIVVPVFNEERTIAEVIQRLAALEIDREIIVVDDCSTDGTLAALRAFEREKVIRLAVHERNQGKGAALRTGFLLARGTYLAVQDADLEYDPAELPTLLAPLLADEADVVYGSRFLAPEASDSRSLVHRWGNRLLTAASNRFTGLSLTDMETCHKVFRRSLLQGITLEQDRFGFEPEITAKLAHAGARFRELPISYHGRTYAEGKKIGLRDLFNALACIVRYRK